MEQPYDPPTANMDDDYFAAPAVTQDEKTWAMLSHLLILVAGFVAPLVIYLVKKDESRYVAEHAKDALNFQITVFLAAMCCIPLIFILIGIPLIFVVSIGSLVCTILASIEASKGRHYRYPMCIRFIT